MEELQKKDLVGKSMLKESLLYVDEDYFGWMLHNKKNNQLLGVIRSIWTEMKNSKPKTETVN